ncbi:MAG: HupE/UreJ family protein [Candidatus Sumerlaeia bacterium]|nr:HupE/UreJ family protein [Candidatus Sumerlaeia bacterium]
MNRTIAVALAALPMLAHAHADGAHTHQTPFASGLFHPWTGLDHLVVLSAIGLWAAKEGGPLRRLIPACALLGMLAGGLAGLAGVVLPLVEPLILASVLVLAMMLLRAEGVSKPAAACLSTAVAFFHGHAHGAEFGASGSAAAYCAGFLLSTAALLAAGYGAGMLLHREGVDSRLRQLTWRATGAAVGLAGLALIAQG